MAAGSWTRSIWPTVAVRMSTMVKSDSAGSNACDSKCNWGGLLLLIPAVARALVALSRNSAKDMALNSTHCDYNERAVSIRNCVVDEYSWRLATSRMDVTSMISNDVADVPRSASISGKEVKEKKKNLVGTANSDESEGCRGSCYQHFKSLKQSEEA